MFTGLCHGFAIRCAHTQRMSVMWLPSHEHQITGDPKGNINWFTKRLHRGAHVGRCQPLQNLDLQLHILREVCGHTLVKDRLHILEKLGTRRQRCAAWWGARSRRSALDTMHIDNVQLTTKWQSSSSSSCTNPNHMNECYQWWVTVCMVCGLVWFWVGWCGQVGNTYKTGLYGICIYMCMHIYIYIYIYIYICIIYIIYTIYTTHTRCTGYTIHSVYIMHAQYTVCNKCNTWTI